jgi:maleate cis-trans isomerase
LSTQRRSFLSGCVAAIAASQFGVRDTLAQGKVPVLGLIFPPFGRGVPEEGIAMYGDRVRFVVNGLGLDRMTPEGYDAVIERIPAAAEELAAAGADAIELTGTSLTFYKGEAFNQRLRQAVVDASGLQRHGQRAAQRISA